jgi:hypothetical protein
MQMMHVTEDTTTGQTQCEITLRSEHPKPSPIEY